METVLTFRLGRRPALDGLRAIAVLSVLVFHLRSNQASVFGLRGGFLGVDIFFVLSGFLITTLLLEEIAEHGRIQLGRFYARRALRLFPALLAMLAFFVAWALVLGPKAEVHDALIESLGALFYFENWVAGFTSIRDAGIGHTWSLAVEEQFYIVWPLLLFLLLRAGRVRGAAFFCAAGLLIVPLLRVVEWRGSASIQRYYVSTDTRADSLLAGCLLALVLAAGVPQVVDHVLRRCALPATAFIVFCLVAVYQHWTVLFLVGFTMYALATAVIIYDVVQHRWLAGLLEHRVLQWIGRRSYGIYLWQSPLLAAAAWETGRVRYGAPIALLLSFLVPALSYRYVELPFLRLKGRYAAAAASPAVEAVPAATLAA